MPSDSRAVTLLWWAAVGGQRLHRDMGSLQKVGGDCAGRWGLCSGWMETVQGDGGSLQWVGEDCAGRWGLCSGWAETVQADGFQGTWHLSHKHAGSKGLLSQTTEKHLHLVSEFFLENVVKICAFETNVIWLDLNVKEKRYVKDKNQALF